MGVKVTQLSNGSGQYMIESDIGPRFIVVNPEWLRRLIIEVQRLRIY